MIEAKFTKEALTKMALKSRYIVTRSNSFEGYQIWDRKLKKHIGSKTGHLIIWKTKQAAMKRIPELPK